MDEITITLTEQELETLRTCLMDREIHNQLAAQKEREGGVKRAFPETWEQMDHDIWAIRRKLNQAKVEA
jgi:uncharacterized protein YndB with AHSA1/START domain